MARCCYDSGLAVRPGQGHWTLAEKLDVDPHTLLHRSESAATALPAKSDAFKAAEPAR